MKRILNSRIFIFILGLIIAGSAGAYAAIKIQASEIGYNDTTVDQVLDELYTKKSQGVQVTTLTTQGASYTMQNDGYIIGYVHPTYKVAGALIYLNGEIVFHAVYDEDVDKKVSIYAPKGSIVATRSGYGTYNLTVYEWK